MSGKISTGPTLELIGLMIDQSPITSLMMVFTYRPEFVPAWPARSYVTPIILNRLDRPQIEVLVTALVSGKTCPATSWTTSSRRPTGFRSMWRN